MTVGRRPVERTNVADARRPLLAIGGKSLLCLIGVEAPHARARLEIRTRLQTDGRRRRQGLPGRGLRLRSTQVRGRVERDKQVSGAFDGTSSLPRNVNRYTPDGVLA